MIAEAVRILRDELANYIVNHSRDTDPIVDQDIVLENLANLESEGGDLENNVIISLVNVQEEETLKNLPNYKRNPITGSYDYDRPPAYVNLFLLVGSSPANGTAGYEVALDRLSLIIEFFQAKNYFTLANSPQSSVAQAIAADPGAALELHEIKMYVDLYSLTFEQINHLWGSLGGKQIPSVLYKVRLVKVQSRAEIPARLVERIHGDTSPTV